MLRHSDLTFRNCFYLSSNGVIKTPNIVFIKSFRDDLNDSQKFNEKGFLFREKKSFKSSERCEQTCNLDLLQKRSLRNDNVLVLFNSIRLATFAKIRFQRNGILKSCLHVRLKKLFIYNYIHKLYFYCI